MGEVKFLNTIKITAEFLIVHKSRCTNFFKFNYFNSMLASDIKISKVWPTGKLHCLSSI